MCSRSPQNFEFGHFSLLFCIERQRNVPKCKTHVQGIVLLIKTYCLVTFSLPLPSWLLKLSIVNLQNRRYIFAFCRRARRRAKPVARLALRAHLALASARLKVQTIAPVLQATLLATPETLGRLSTSVQRFDIWDRLGNKRELQLVHGFQGNCQRIEARDNYPNDPSHRSVER